MAEPIMKLYTEATDGSYIETKESALVWHHQDADPGFGSAQAKEMLDHLESVLANEPVSVKSGQHIVEVNPQVLNFSKTHYVLRMVEIDTYVVDVHVPHTMCKIVYLLVFLLFT